MCSHCWNKLIAVSLALGVAGLLMCTFALLDVFIPGGSLTGFFASTVLLAIIITGVVIGYTWACDKCESFFNGRLDRLLRRSKPNRSDSINSGDAANPRPAEPRAIDVARSTPDARQPPVFCERCVATLPGSVLRKDATNATAVHTWQGQ
jgi:hypothetical protein